MGIINTQFNLHNTIGTYCGVIKCKLIDVYLNYNYFKLYCTCKMIETKYKNKAIFFRSLYYLLIME